MPKRGRLLSPANPKVGLGFSAAQRDGVFLKRGTTRLIPVLAYPEGPPRLRSRETVTVISHLETAKPIRPNFFAL